MELKDGTTINFDLSAEDATVTFKRSFFFHWGEFKANGTQYRVQSNCTLLSIIQTGKKELEPILEVRLRPRRKEDHRLSLLRLDNLVYLYFDGDLVASTSELIDP